MDASRAKENLREDFKILLEDAQELLRATTGLDDEKAGKARENLEKTISEAKARYQDIEQALERSADKVDEFVHKKPYQAAGITLAAGLVLGWLFSRK